MKAQLCYLAAVASTAVGLVSIASCTPERESDHGPTGTPAPADRGPLEVALGFDPLSPMESSPEVTKRLEEIEIEIAACMKDHGFDYVPWPEPIEELRLDGSATAQEGEWGSLTYRERYGFGISIQDPHEESASPRPPDPNDATIAALSSTEREAWRLALDGTDMGYTRPVERHDGTTGMAYRPEDAGCIGTARSKVLAMSPESVRFDPRLDRISLAVQKMAADYVNSSDLATVYSDWASCMKSEGYDDFTSPLDAFTRASNVNSNPWSFDLEPAEVPDWEIELAVADFECQAEHRTIERQEDLLRDYEQRFVDEHQGEIELVLQEIASTPQATS